MISSSFQSFFFYIILFFVTWGFIKIRCPYTKLSLLDDKRRAEVYNKILEKYNTDKELKNDEYQTVKILEEIHKVEPPGLKEDYKKFVQLYNKYNSMLTNSYAVITNIVTISKYKIVKPINDLDPLKNLVVQTSILNKIDSEIITRYTHHFD